jgi:hypothetical protein
MAADRAEHAQRGQIVPPATPAPLMNAIAVGAQYRIETL